MGALLEKQELKQNQVFNVSIPVPENLVVVDKDQYLQLLAKSEEGKWWLIDDVVELLSISRSTLINDILLNPKFKNEIDVEQNNAGFVLYPRGKGSPYRFLASRTRKYFEENFASILLR
ncbi:DUF771 domain-containing protein [Streptococcus acidominimus]|uniref:DUF771 domain-containing protein n=1 Tax=Streptococcus acidominimus TaxID=1326 RepID=A0A4Y9FRK9_STRAI|nr:DUF771 domain-containing protein [Streptococcus acidominimus]MBF0817879.1 DUF771 domain-containing protein [Streptococcus acidominimus]MBF0838395.1 DUF771 domain-containing protein [Streptococcus acidominimus]MBF0846242.1 DUF771 domain-containing protein [Streptococcus danieliae]TFU31867.1 DUF771 domain-containing protein [Streptococcus acidominimus]